MTPLKFFDNLNSPTPIFLSL